MRIQDLNGKKVAIVGYAREGRDMHQALTQFAPDAIVTICDQQDVTPLHPATTQTGPDYLNDLERFDVIVKSSGIPDLPAFAPHSEHVVSQTDILFDTVAGSGVKIIGVTGTKGKSTTTTLIYEALKHAVPKVYLMGNIGIPAISFIGKAEPGALFVMELSSYQLEHLKTSPAITVLTSFFPEHLDRHGSIDNYWQAKSAATRYQTKDDVVFYNAASPECARMAQLSPGKKIPFTADDFPLSVTQTKFQGNHNRLNLAAAYMVTRYLGVPAAGALATLSSAEPLPHRLQPLGKHHGIYWYDDSIATAPEATLSALEALPDVDTLIVGGLDRGISFEEFGKALAASKVGNIILFPDTGQKIKAFIEQNTPSPAKNYFATSNMDEAVTWAAQHTVPGKICLLSAASPSFNLFKDFEARGQAFAQAIKEYKPG